VFRHITDKTAAIENTIPPRLISAVSIIPSQLPVMTSEFLVVNNDRKIETMVYLLHLRNLFSKALVKMPRDYLVKMIFDRRHFTYTMLREDGTVVGGLCFRPFAQRGFAEVVFLAVASGDQVKGKGTRLMNHFKEHCKRELGIKYLLTYADNFAIGYFKKQGFSEEITLPNNVWKGYIKDYDGGTMMGCRLYEHLDYRNISESLKDIMTEVQTTLSNPTSTVPIYPGLQKFPIEDINSIPGLENYKAEESWTFKSGGGALCTQIANILNIATLNPSSWAFRDPVDENLVPGYHSVISHPMSLSVMRQKNERGVYTDKEDFRSDVRLMIDNCIMFNGPRHDITKRGQEIVAIIMPMIDKIVQYATAPSSEDPNSEIRKRQRA
jgi:histone acetyltransferase